MPDAIEKILVATDGSRNVERAIDYAVTIASISGAKLVGVYVVDHKYCEPLVKATSGRDVTKFREEAIKKVKLKAEFKKVPCDGVILEGDPAKKIIEYVKKTLTSLSWAPWVERG